MPYAFFLHKLAVRFEDREVIAKPHCTSAPDFLLSLAVFRNLFADNILRQSLLRSGAVYQLRWTCKTNVLQVAPMNANWYDGNRRPHNEVEYSICSKSKRMLTFLASHNGATLCIRWNIGYQEIFEKTGFPRWMRHHKCSKCFSKTLA